MCAKFCYIAQIGSEFTKWFKPALSAHPSPMTFLVLGLWVSNSLRFTYKHKHIHMIYSKHILRV